MLRVLFLFFVFFSFSFGEDINTTCTCKEGEMFIVKDVESSAIALGVNFQDNYVNEICGEFESKIYTVYSVYINQNTYGDVYNIYQDIETIKCVDDNRTDENNTCNLPDTPFPDMEDNATYTDTNGTQAECIDGITESQSISCNIDYRCKMPKDDNTTKPDDNSTCPNKDENGSCLPDESCPQGYDSNNTCYPDSDNDGIPDYDDPTPNGGGTENDTCRISDEDILFPPKDETKFLYTTDGLSNCEDKNGTLQTALIDCEPDSRCEVPIVIDCGANQEYRNPPTDLGCENIPSCDLTKDGYDYQGLTTNLECSNNIVNYATKDILGNPLGTLDKLRVYRPNDDEWCCYYNIEDNNTNECVYPDNMFGVPFASFVSNSLECDSLAINTMEHYLEPIVDCTDPYACYFEPIVPNENNDTNPTPDTNDTTPTPDDNTTNPTPDTNDTTPTPDNNDSGTIGVPISDPEHNGTASSIDDNTTDSTDNNDSDTPSIDSINDLISQIKDTLSSSSSFIDTAFSQFSTFSSNVDTSLTDLQLDFENYKNLFNDKPIVNFSSSGACDMSIDVYEQHIDFGKGLCDGLHILSPYLYFVVSLLSQISLIFLSLYLIKKD